MSKSESTSIFGLMGLAFVILKLIGIIKWSWFWVLLPWTFPMVLFGIIILGAGFFALIGWGVDKYNARQLAKPTLA